METERNLLAAMAVLLISYALVALLAWGSRGESLRTRLSRAWKRRRGDS